MPEIPVTAEAGLFRDMVGGLLCEPPAKGVEDAATNDIHDLTRAVADQPPELPSHTRLRETFRAGGDIYHPTRDALIEAGPEGTRALQILDHYRPGLVYHEGGGSFYDQASRTIHIDLNNGNPAVGIIHEATHLHWKESGLSADVTKMSRQDFIERWLSEETDASTREIYANSYLQSHNPGLNLPNAAQQDEFIAAYNTAADHAAETARIQGRWFTPNDRAIAGDTAGRQVLYNAYRDGRAITSTTRESYVEFNGRFWDNYQASLLQNGHYR